MNEHINYQSLLEDAKATFQNLEFTKDCPVAEAIVDYVYDDLSESSRSKITKHITGCESCRLLALKIETDRTELELMIDKSPEKVLEDIIGPSLKDKLLGKKTTAIKKSSLSLSQIKDAMISWVSPTWEPKFAGQMVTAADITEQTKQFEMDYGEYVNISCYWKGKESTREPYLYLSWKANYHTPSIIWVRFVDPDSNAVLSESCLGTDLEGYRQLTVKELGFDPTDQRWAISIVTEII